MTPTALSIVSTTFPEGSERNKALGIWGALGGIGATAAWLIGAALGVAIVSTVAVSRSEDDLAANEDATPPVVLNEGFQSAFRAVVVLAGIDVALALLLLGRPQKAPQERLEAVPVPIQTTKEQTVRRVMVRFKVRADQAATNEQVGG